MKEKGSSTAIINKGKYLPTGKIITIDEASRGGDCNCICPNEGCGIRLVAAKGEINIDHFRHAEETDCKGGQETALHQLGKEILLAHHQINIPAHGRIVYTDQIAEKPLGAFRPDITATYKDAPIYFEIIVTNKPSFSKEYFLLSEKHRSIAIDLSKYVGSGIRSEIEQAVLEKLSNKRIIFWEDEPEQTPVPIQLPVTKPTAHPSEGLTIKDFAFIAVALLAFIYLINRLGNWLRGIFKHKK
jgi:hypothetical protein